MSSTIVRYAGLRYLDRTPALETGEVWPRGARLEMTFVEDADQALALLEAGTVDCAEVPLAVLGDEDLISRFTALPVFLNRADVAEMAPVAGTRTAETSSVWQRAAIDGFLPLLTVVVVRRDLYEAKRWLAVSLTDAFVEAQELGIHRNRYFGALSVGLPWLMPALERADAGFPGGAYRHGLEPNRTALQAFATASGKTSDDDTLFAPFAPESRPLNGIAEATFYVVPVASR